MSNPLKDLLLSLEDLGLSLEDLRAIAQFRGIKDYESMLAHLSSIIFPSKKTKNAKKVKNQKQVFLKQE